MRTKLITVGITVAMLGCAGPSRLVRPTRVAVTLPSTMDRVWGALMAVVVQRSLPIQAIEKESGVLTTDFVLLEGGDFDLEPIAHLPGSALGISLRARYKLSIHVSPMNDTTTTITATAHIESFEKDLFSSGWKACPSKGVLETQLIGAVQTRLSESRPH